MTYLGIDLGKKRIGLAISHGEIATELATIGYDNGEYLSKLKEIIAQQKVDLIVVGLPLKRDGSSSQQTDWTRSEIKRIEEKLNLKVVTTEESFTSEEAKRLLGNKALKEEIDSFSAKLILEQYFNENRNKSIR